MPNKPTDSDRFNEISTLYEISRLLASSLELSDCLDTIMSILSEEKEMTNGTVTIVNPRTGKLEIEVAHRLSAPARSHEKYRKGEGITAGVVTTGDPVIVPKITNEPLFLDKTQAHGEQTENKRSFICVPLKKGSKTIGALSIDKIYPGGLTEEANSDLKFLMVLSSLIVQTVIRVQKINSEKRLLTFENLRLKRELSEKNSFCNVVGNSVKMQNVYETIHRAIDSSATVLLRGESGTGKTLLARTLHYSSERKDAPFVIVNCSALPETLLEKEIFGYKDDFLADAIEGKTGKIEQAEGGTLFLDEIGKINSSTQRKLLNIIQENKFQQSGSTQIIEADIRIVAASNRHLEKAVELNTFREDLYYRLNVFPVYIPPLRERRTDILLLAEYFLEKYSKKNQKKITRISTSAIDMLIEYHWPGNVRELQNCIEQAAIMCGGVTLKSIHLPPSLQTSQAINRPKSHSLAISVENFEKELIVEGLKRNNGNQTKTSRELNTSLRIINYKIHQYEIDPKKYKI